MSRAAALVALALLCATVTAQAQDRVYRCGPDGRSYSHEPCTGGRTVDVADARSAQQAAQTRQAMLRDAREADELERVRLRTERLAARQGPALIGSASKARHVDEARCAKGASCARGEPSKRRDDKARTVTLYRAAETR